MECILEIIHQQINIEKWILRNQEMHVKVNIKLNKVNKTKSESRSRSMSAVNRQIQIYSLTSCMKRTLQV